MKSLENVPEDEEMNETEAFQYSNVSAYMLKSKGTFEGLSIYTSDDQVYKEADFRDIWTCPPAPLWNA